MKVASMYLTLRYSYLVFLKYMKYCFEQPCSCPEISFGSVEEILLPTVHTESCCGQTKFQFNTTEMLAKIKLTDLDEMIENKPVDFVKEMKSASFKKEDVKANSDVIEENSLPRASPSSDVQKVIILVRMYL